MKLKDVPMPPLLLVSQEEALKALEIASKVPQAASTMAILNRPLIDDLKAMQRTTGSEAQVKDDKGNVDLWWKPIDLEQINYVEATRRRPKNSRFQSVLSSVNPQKLRNAIFKFMSLVGTTTLSQEDKDRLFSYSGPSKAWSEVAEEVFKASPTREEFEFEMAKVGLSHEAEAVLAYLNKGEK